jgi:hypothetical protein
LFGRIILQALQLLRARRQGFAGEDGGWHVRHAPYSERGVDGFIGMVALQSGAVLTVHRVGLIMTLIQCDHEHDDGSASAKANGQDLALVLG